jgi:hypothetical protein
MGEGMQDYFLAGEGIASDFAESGSLRSQQGASLYRELALTSSLLLINQQQTR